MAGAGLGLLLGLGLASIWWSFWPRERAEPVRTSRRWLDRLGDEVALAGIRGLGPGGLLGFAVVLAVLVAAIVLAVTRVAPIAVCFGAMAGWAPFAYVRARARKRRGQLREVWPDVIDHVHSAVRAGLALPEALVQLGDRGPVELREQFVEFAHDYRASGRFSESLDRLKDRLADPVADRLVEALRIARDVGGNDLGRVLRTLSAFLREDMRARAELGREARLVNPPLTSGKAPVIWVGEEEITRPRWQNHTQSGSTEGIGEVYEVTDQTRGRWRRSAGYSGDGPRQDCGTSPRTVSTRAWLVTRRRVLSRRL